MANKSVKQLIEDFQFKMGPSAKQRWAGRKKNEMARKLELDTEQRKADKLAALAAGYQTGWPKVWSEQREENDMNGKPEDAHEMPEVSFDVHDTTPNKPWWQSKSLLIAAIMVAMTGLEAYQNGATPVLIAMAVLGALSAAVRTVTSKRLTR